ncbi:threonine dehydrogenase-like Zn-dependent dehydrogenase [Micromonospora vinacea]|uniref:Threonine dehydrogenase-like Zn-dependent dehydrogenase n=1 Tax=Micromonospora vinacea TaxID=709878 RepID=A0ABS0K7X2_9ACTN|nr:DUF6069 family protein [Micromonospora vinacea]MBG6104733.1 threonine dehydrogenase-like Zn-dependent dehydrogenase [Micromonospora vinacea]
MSAATVTTPAPSPLRRRALGVAAAVVAPLAIWAVGALAGVDYTVESPGQPATVIGAGAIVMIALVAALLGWAVLALLERFATRVARPVWISLAIVVTVLSFVPVLSVEATGGAKLALGATHVAVAAALIALLPRPRR